jgi:O-antigen/teichoic acid export membrane protein
MPDITESAGQLARSAAVLVARKIVGSGLSAVSTVLVVRSLAPEEFGQYAAGLAAFYLLVALTEFGFGEVLGRALGRTGGAVGGLGRLVLAVNLVWSLVVALFGVLLAGLFAFGSIRGGTLLVMTPAVALAGTTALRQYFFARHEVGRMATIDLSVSLITTAVISALALLDASAVALAGAASAGAAVNGALVLAVTWGWLSPGDQSVAETERYSVGRLVKEAFPIGLASWLATAYFSIDLIILSELFAGETVGRYASAVKVLSILTIFPGLVMAVALPRLSADWSDPQRLGPMLCRLWHWFMSLAMPILVIVAANASGVMTVLVGEAYTTAGAYLRILTIAGAVSMLSQLLGVVVVAGARARLLVVQNALALGVNVAGNLLLTPRLGIVAAGWLTVATELMVCVCSWAILRDRLPYGGLARVSLLPLGAVVLAVPIGWVFASAPWVAMSLSATIYVAVLSALRGWPVELVRMVPNGGIRA